MQKGFWAARVRHDGKSGLNRKKHITKEIEDKINNLLEESKRKEAEEILINDQIIQLQKRKDNLWAEYAVIANQLYFLKQGKNC